MSFVISTKHETFRRKPLEVKRNLRSWIWIWKMKTTDWKRTSWEMFSNLHPSIYIHPSTSSQPYAQYICCRQTQTLPPSCWNAFNYSTDEIILPDILSTYFLNIPDHFLTAWLDHSSQYKMCLQWRQVKWTVWYKIQMFVEASMTSCRSSGGQRVATSNSGQWLHYFQASWGWLCCTQLSPCSLLPVPDQHQQHIPQATWWSSVVSDRQWAQVV